MPSDPFASVAAHYEGWYETPEGRRADRLEKGLLGWLLQALPGSDSLLEVGCGTAHFTRWVKGQGLKTVGLDRSAPMLTQARALDGVPLVRGDGHRLPFPSGAFDVVMFVTTLEFLERPHEALAETLRVARRGLLLGVLNGWSVLGLWRRLIGLFRPDVYSAAHFYGIGELRRLLRSVAGEGAPILWRTTLFPRWCPWEQARLPWGGFIGIACILIREEARWRR